MLYNKAKQKIISTEEIMATGFLSQARGLMFRRKQNLIIILPQEQKVSLHMFFVFYPIDVLILDEQKKIVEIKRNFRPFTFWTSPQKGKYVVELALPRAYDSTYNSAYNIGDTLEFRGILQKH